MNIRKLKQLHMVEVSYFSS